MNLYEHCTNTTNLDRFEELPFQSLQKMHQTSQEIFQSGPKTLKIKKQTKLFPNASYRVNLLKCWKLKLICALYYQWRAFDPIKAGGSESTHSLGSIWRPPPLKTEKNRHRVEMHGHSPIFQGQLNETDNFNCLGAMEGWKKCLNQGQKIFFKNIFFCFKQISKCDTCILQGL